MGKTYIQPGEFATIQDWQGRYLEVDDKQIKKIVWDNTRYMPQDEYPIGPDQIIGFDEDGSYICLVR